MRFHSNHLLLRAGLLTIVSEFVASGSWAAHQKPVLQRRSDHSVPATILTGPGTPTVHAAPVGGSAAHSNVFAATTWYVDISACPGPGTGTSSSPFCTIGQGIDAAADGDTVLVRPGTYVGVLSFVTKDIVVRSDVDGLVETIDPDPIITIIDGAGGGPVVDFPVGSTNAAVLEGFTLINGSTATTGGGIRAIFSSPTIRGNIIRNSFAQTRGGAIFLASATPVIENNLIESNVAGGYGGGIYIEFGASMTVSGNIVRNNQANKGGGIYILSNHGALSRNTITGNSAPDGGGGVWLENASPSVVANVIAGNIVGHYGGGGLFMNGGAAPTITNNLVLYNSTFGMFGYGGGCLVNSGASSPVLFINNTFVGNSGTLGGAFLLSSASTVNFYNGILWGNQSSFGPVAHLQGASSFFVSHSDVEGGIGSIQLSGSPSGTVTYDASNISADPLFADPLGSDLVATAWEDNDYHLTGSSPCVDSGNNSVAPSQDFEGDPRPVDGDQDGQAVADIGVDELYCQLSRVGVATPGATITLIVNGPPGTVGYLYFSGGEQQPPIPTPWGNLQLQLPINGVTSLGTLPAGGSVNTPLTIPRDAQVGLPLYYIQAFVGEKLTNLLIVVVQ